MEAKHTLWVHLWCTSDFWIEAKQPIRRLGEELDRVGGLTLGSIGAHALEKPLG